MRNLLGFSVFAILLATGFVFADGSGSGRQIAQNYEREVSELDGLVGTWVVTAEEIDGKLSPPEAGAPRPWIDKTWRFCGDGSFKANCYAGTYIARRGRSVSSLDLQVISETGELAWVHRWLFELRGQNLRIWFVVGHPEMRPRQLNSSESQGMRTYRRVENTAQQ